MSTKWLATAALHERAQRVSISYRDRFAQNTIAKAPWQAQHGTLATLLTVSWRIGVEVAVVRIVKRIATC